MYSGKFPPDIQFETSWKGLRVTPRRGTIFGCDNRFQIIASRQKVCEFRYGRETRKATPPTTHFNGLLRAILGIHPHAFDANP